MKKTYVIFGIIGCLCFGIGDWLLGYDMEKAVVTLIMMVIGICFLYPGLFHISEIAKNEKTKRSLKYACGLCSFGWLTLHINVTLNVIAFCACCP